MADNATKESFEIKLNQSYHLALESASDEVTEYEERSGFRFGFLRSDPDFGSIAWTKDDCRIQWEEMEMYHGEKLEFDGVPFMVLGTKHLSCQYGVRIPTKQNRYQEWRKEEGSEALGRKSSCPARIVMKEVIKFPDYKISSNTTYERKKWSKILREDIYTGLAESQRRIYVYLPSDDDHLHSHSDKQSAGHHCLICNGMLPVSARSAISLFTNGIRTTHRQLEVVGLISEIVGQSVEEDNAHSQIICTRCFNLIDDIDSLEEQLVNKKQMVANQYRRTLAEVTNAPASPIDSIFFSDDESDTEDIPFAKRQGRGRKRHKRPPGRPRGSGRGRGGRGRGRGQERDSVITNDEHDVAEVFVKIEHEDSNTSSTSETPVIRTNTTIFKPASDSPTVLNTIKKEDIMTEAETCEADQDNIESIEAVAVDSDDDVAKGKVLAVIGSESGLEPTVLEVVEEELEEEQTKGKRYGCSQCNKQFSTKAAIKNHVKTHDRFDTTYDCEECEKSFTNKCSLKAHLKTHLNRDRPHTCHVCGNSFYTRYHLNAHLKSHGGGRNFVCELCGKALSTQKTLELHTLTHTGEKPFQCEICGSTFRQRSNLLTHIKTTHYQEKNYHCEICKKSFVRKRLLVYHMNSVHTGQRPYKCELCNASFVYPHYYKRHLRKHTGDRPHKCHVCGKTFASRENRNAHMFTHSDKKPYECKLCGAGFMRKPLCASHVLLHGQLENPEQHITFNSPSLLLNESENKLVNLARDEVAQAVTSVKVDEDDVQETMEDQTKIVKVMSRPVHIIETDDTTRYVIQTGDRVREENMDQFFAALQSHVVEVRTEDF